MFAENLDILDHVQNRTGAFGFDAFIEDELLEGPANVLRRQMNTIAESGLGIQVDTKPQPVGIELPGIGEHPSQFEGVWIVGRHRFKDLIGDSSTVDVA